MGEDEIKNVKGKKKVVLFSVLGVLAVVIAIVVAIIVVNVTSKPSKKSAKKIVQSYVDALNDRDGDAMLKCIDTEGFIIFKEEGEKKFNKEYKNKKKYIKEYLEDNDYDDLEEFEEDLVKSLGGSSSYTSSLYKYKVKEVTDVKKSEKSKNLIVIKAKIKAESSSLYGSDTTKTVKFYVLKVKGKYKIVGADI